MYHDLAIFLSSSCVIILESKLAAVEEIESVQCFCLSVFVCFRLSVRQCSRSQTVWGMDTKLGTEIDLDGI